MQDKITVALAEIKNYYLAMKKENEELRKLYTQMQKDYDKLKNDYDECKRNLEKASQETSDSQS